MNQSFCFEITKNEVRVKRLMNGEYQNGDEVAGSDSDEVLIGPSDGVGEGWSADEHGGLETGVGVLGLDLGIGGKERHGRWDPISMSGDFSSVQFSR